MRKFFAHRIYKYTALLMLLLAGIAAVSGCSIKKEVPLVTMTVWGASEEQELLEQMVEDFRQEYADEARLEITVCEESEGTCSNTVMFCPEAAADIFFFADDQLSLLAEGGALLPITENAEEVKAACGGADSVAVSAASYKGTFYAYPSTASNGYFLFYNSDYFSEEDVKSLDCILEVAKKNGKKFGMEMTSGWYMYSFYKAAGMDVCINEDGITNTCDWNRTGPGISGVDVTESLLDIAGHEGFLNVGNDAFVEGIQDGSIIAGISGTWNANIIREAFGDGYAACKLPTYTVNGKQLQMHSVAGYKLVGVNAYSGNPVWAQRLAEWVTNEENQLKRFEVRGEGPANVNAAQNEKVQQSIAIAALSDQMQFGHLQYVAGCYWDEAYRLGNVIVAGNIENRDLQELLDEFVGRITDASE